MDHRPGGPPPPPRGKRIAPAHHDDHRLEPSTGAGYYVPRRLGERELDRNHDRDYPEENATIYTSRNILAETPETTVGEHVHMKGELSFERLLRVDGSFKGQLVSTGDLVIGVTGVVRGNIEHLREVVSDGTIIGNIQAERVRLRRSAIVIGDVACLSISIDPDVSISGVLNVHKEAPNKLHLEGQEGPPEDEDEDFSENKSAGGTTNVDDHKRKNSKKEGSSKKESSSTERDRRPKEDKGKDEPRKKKEGESSKSKTSSK
ncbi:unnamed protein product [Pylaiella littoralis]